VSPAAPQNSGDDGKRTQAGDHPSAVSSASSEHEGGPSDFFAAMASTALVVSIGVGRPGRQRGEPALVAFYVRRSAQA